MLSWLCVLPTSFFSQYTQSWSMLSCHSVWSTGEASVSLCIIHWSLHGNLSAGCIVFESGLTFLKTTESFSVSENTARVSTAVQFQCSHHLAHHAYQTEGPDGSSRLPRCLCSWVCHLPLPCASPYMYVVLVFPLTVGVQALEQGKTAEGAH